MCGSAAAHCGKALPYRQTAIKVIRGFASYVEAEPRRRFYGASDGKPEAFRSVRRQSRKRCACRRNQRVPYLSFKISIAALRPLAPMIPPPGCVAEPHM